jgi:hypothetical protein
METKLDKDRKRSAEGLGERGGSEEPLYFLS